MDKSDAALFAVEVGSWVSFKTAPKFDGTSKYAVAAVPVESVKIILLCVLATIVYRILQDQVTARVCVEHFTIGHPPVSNTDSPTPLAFGWGEKRG